MMLLADGIWQNIEAWLFIATTALAGYTAVMAYINRKANKLAKAACDKAEAERVAREDAEKRKQRDAEFSKVAAIANAVESKLDTQTTTLTRSIHDAVDQARKEFKAEFQRMDERLSKVESANDAIKILREWHQDVDSIVEQLRKKEHP